MALFGLAITGSTCWIIYWSWYYATTCSLEHMSGGRAISCHWQTAEAGGISVVSRTAPALTVLWDMAARTIGIPACAIIAGIALAWVIQRFRRRFH